MHQRHVLHQQRVVLPHYCLGFALAKLEAQVAIESLLQRYTRVELADEPIWRDRLTIRGVDRLTLAVA